MNSEPLDWYLDQQDKDIEEDSHHKKEDCPHCDNEIAGIDIQPWFGEDEHGCPVYQGHHELPIQCQCQCHRGISDLPEKGIENE